MNDILRVLYVKRVVCAINPQRGMVGGRDKYGPYALLAIWMVLPARGCRYEEGGMAEMFALDVIIVRRCMYCGGRKITYVKWVKVMGLRITSRREKNAQ